MESRAEEAAPAAVADGNGSSGENSEKSWQKRDRELLMVVVTFVATMAFQAGVNPPGGVWQDDDNPKYQAGKSIMAAKSPSQFVTFIASVTVCMACSLMQLLVLLLELPQEKLSVSRNFLYFTMGTAIAAIATAYWSSVKALTPESLIPNVSVALLTNLVVSVVILATLLCVQKIRDRC